MERTLFLDTNALLNLQEKAFEEHFFISQKTLEEVESIKQNARKDGATKIKGRKVSHLLDDHDDGYTVVPTDSSILSIIADKGLEETPDNIILAAAYKQNQETPLLVVTDDVNAKFISKKIFGLTTKGVRELNLLKDPIYKGYREIKGTTEEINKAMAEMDDLVPNEYVIIENTDDGSEKEMRFDGEKFVGLKLPPSRYIKGKNALQRCALDLLMNPDIPIVAVLGSFGSGKSKLATAMALYAVREKGHQSKVLIVREPSGEGEQIGWLRGDYSDKTEHFFEPIVQQLDGGEFEYASLVQQGVLDTAIPFYLKGTTYNDTVMVCDEAEDFTEAVLRLVGTRVGQNSRIFFAGDYKQSLVNKSFGNPLVRMCNEFRGDPRFGCIYLSEDVRSETSKMFAYLFEEE